MLSGQGPQTCTRIVHNHNSKTQLKNIPFHLIQNASCPPSKMIMDREASSAASGPAFVPVVVTTEEMNDIVAMLSSMERDLDGTENLVRQGRVKRSTSRHAQARRRRTGTKRPRTAHGVRTSTASITLIVVDDNGQ